MPRSRLWAKAFYVSKIEGVELSASAHLRKLLADGIDPMQETIDFCRKNETERYVEFACLEDVSSLEPLPNILLRLTVKDLSDDDVCSFLFNGEPLPPPSEQRLTPKGRMFEYTLLPVDVRRGANRIEAQYGPAEGSAGEAMLVGVELRIRYEMTNGQ